MGSQKKVFGIGFQKTATTSLAAALYILGYNVTGYFGVHDPEIAEKVYDMSYDLADRFDAAQDTPWPVLYKELDRRYPGSKFILTIRPTDEWIRSIVKHFKNHYIPAHEWIYGVKTAKGNEEVYMVRYEEHNREVLDYFHDRPDDLLVMSITKGDGWEKLCPFLDKEIPSLDFPVQNTARERWNHIIRRGSDFAIRKLLNKDRGAGRSNQLEQGVSATFIRDVLHYHCSMFDNLWECVQLVSAGEFVQGTAYSGDSIRDHLLQQLSEERLWLNRLEAECFDATGIAAVDSNYRTKQDVFQLYQVNKLLLREYVANLSDRDCISRVPGRNEYVWEVFVHLMNQGTERRAWLRQLLHKMGVAVDEHSFLEFFRGGGN